MFIVDKQNKKLSVGGVFTNISGILPLPVRMLGSMMKEHQAKQAARKEQQGET